MYIYYSVMCFFRLLLSVFGLWDDILLDIQLALNDWDFFCFMLWLDWEIFWDAVGGWVLFIFFLLVCGLPWLVEGLRNGAR